MVLGALPSQPAWLCGVPVNNGVAWTTGVQVLDMCKSLRASRMTAVLKVVHSGRVVVMRASE